MKYKRLVCAIFALALVGVSVADAARVFADEAEGAEGVGEIANVEGAGTLGAGEGAGEQGEEEEPVDAAAPALLAAPANNGEGGPSRAAAPAADNEGGPLRAPGDTKAANEYKMLLSESPKALGLSGVESGYGWTCNVTPARSGLNCSNDNGGTVTATRTGTFTVTFQHWEQTGTFFGQAIYGWADKATATVTVYDYSLATEAQEKVVLEPGDTFDYSINRRGTRGTVETTVTRDGQQIAKNTGMTVPAIDTSEEGEYKISIVNTAAKEAGFEMEDDYYFYVVDPTSDSVVAEQGKKVEAEGSERWSASAARENTVEFLPENGKVMIDTSELSLGMHYFEVVHNFETGESAVVGELTVMVYKITPAEGDYTEEEYKAAADTLKALLEQYGAVEGQGDYIKLVTKVGQIFGATDEGALASNMFGMGVMMGEEIITRAQVDPLDESEVSDALKAKMEALGAENVTYWNVRVLMEVEFNGDTMPLGEMHQLDGTITVAVVEVPSVENGYTRIYYVVREHDGAIEPLTEGVDFFVKDDVVYIISDKFSAYAVGYNDILNTVSTPDTGVATAKGGSATATGSLAVAVAGAAAAVVLAGAAVFAKRK